MSFNHPNNVQRLLKSAFRNVYNQNKQIIHSFVEAKAWEDIDGIFEAMSRYSRTIEPIADMLADRAISTSFKHNERQFIKSNKGFSQLFSQNFINIDASIADEKQKFAELIKSIPMRDAERVQRLVTKGITEGRRQEDIAQDIFKFANVSPKKAEFLARDQTAKINSAVNRAQAVGLGVELYTWKTLPKARPEHEEMKDKICRYDTPCLITSDGQKLHPGEAPNCRCWADPLMQKIFALR